MRLARARAKDGDDRPGRAVSCRSTSDVNVSPVVPEGTSEATVGVRLESERTAVSTTTEPTSERPPGGGDTGEREVLGEGEIRACFMVRWGTWTVRLCVNRSRKG